MITMQELQNEILDRCRCVLCGKPKDEKSQGCDVAFMMGEKTWWPIHRSCVKAKKT